MSQDSVQIIDLPVVFQKGAGIFLAVPVTQFQNNFGEIFSATRNTCKTKEILIGGKDKTLQFSRPENNLQSTIDKLSQTLSTLFPQDIEYISGNVGRLKELVKKLYDLFPKPGVPDNDKTVGVMVR